MKFSTKLQKYIEINNLKKYQLADEIAVTPAMISRYLHDDVMPSYWTAKRISVVTGNVINMNDMGF